jgi:hypothetical protein
VDVLFLKEFLNRHKVLFDAIDRYQCDYGMKNRLINNSYQSWEYIDGEFGGWDFTNYPTYMFMDNGSCDYFAGIINLPEAGGQLDKCPIYLIETDMADMKPRFVGNIREYLRRLAFALIDFLEEMRPAAEEEAEHEDIEPVDYNGDVQRIRDLFEDLCKLSTDVVMPDHELTAQSFQEGNILM